MNEIDNSATSDRITGDAAYCRGHVWGLRPDPVYRLLRNANGSFTIYDVGMAKDDEPTRLRWTEIDDILRAEL